MYVVVPPGGQGEKDFTFFSTIYNFINYEEKKAEIN